jgi:hypothetical protein
MTKIHSCTLFSGVGPIPDDRGPSLARACGVKIERYDCFRSPFSANSEHLLLPLVVISDTIQVNRLWCNAYAITKCLTAEQASSSLSGIELY